MKDEIKARLNATFEQHEANEKAALQAREEAKNKALFLKGKFEHLRSTVIRPAMEEMCEYLKEKGISSEITQRDVEDVLRVSSFELPDIKFTLFPSSRRDAQSPYLHVSYGGVGEVAQFQKSTITVRRGGTSGSDGRVPFSQVTSDLIQEKIMSIVQEVFK